ncbi:phosphoglycolate phosphatase [Thermaurantiacus sp.]
MSPFPSWLQTLAFDLDGTLVDTAPDLTLALNHALALLDRPAVPPESVRALVGHGARRLLERGLGATGGSTPELVEQGLQAFLAYYRANIARESRPFDGAETMLDALAQAGVRLAICTNKPESLTLSLLEALGWQRRFAAVLGADSRPFRKPDPRHLLETLAAAGGSWRGSAYVGDSATDSDTAAAAGIPFVLVSFGYSGEAPSSLKADQRIDHFHELPRALGRIVPPVQAEFTLPR